MTATNHTNACFFTDGIVSIRLDWHTTARLAVKASIRKTSLQGIMEYALAERLKEHSTPTPHPTPPAIHAQHRQPTQPNSHALWLMAARTGLRKYKLPQ